MTKTPDLQVDKTDLMLCLVLLEFYDSMRTLERDPHKDGKQAAAMIMAIHDLKKVCSCESPD